MKSKLLKFTVLFVLLLACACPVFGIEYYLRADESTVSMPGGGVITMWGFAQDSSFGAEDGTVKIPGPQLVVPDDDPGLVIYLDNNLDVPVSIIIPGQNAIVTPVTFTDSKGRKRIRSFTHETDPNNAAAVKYEWPNFRPGTYLYHSASHPAVQVQMGLYGCVKKDTLVLNLGPAGEYNMVIFDDSYLRGSSSEGNIAIGKNAWFQNYGISTSLSAGNAKLVVGENITQFDQGSVGSNPMDPNTLGNIYAFGTANINLVNYDKLITGDSMQFDFKATRNYLLEASDYWGSLTPNGSVHTRENGYLLMRGNDPELNIFSVSGAVFSNTHKFHFSVPAGSTVLVNVDGLNVDMKRFDTPLGEATSENILYNFYQATALTIVDGNPMGSILAPKADVGFTNGIIDGTLIAKSLGTLATQSNGAANNTAFAGSLPQIDTKQAYYGVFYDSDVELIFSEIDPALHQAVASDDFGPNKTVTSTMTYKPKYFLINGQPYSSTNSSLTAGTENERILVRFLNIGLETHVPVSQNSYMTVVAEDGHRYNYTREQYSVIMPGSKTKDAVLISRNAGTYPIYDRRLRLTDNDVSGGGMLRNLMINSGGAPLSGPTVTLSDIAEQWLTQDCDDCSADLNGDRNVNIKDYAIFAQTYNALFN